MLLCPSDILGLAAQCCEGWTCAVRGFRTHIHTDQRGCRDRARNIKSDRLCMWMRSVWWCCGGAAVQAVIFDFHPFYAANRLTVWRIFTWDRLSHDEQYATIKCPHRHQHTHKRIQAEQRIPRDMTRARSGDLMQCEARVCIRVCIVHPSTAASEWAKRLTKPRSRLCARIPHATNVRCWSAQASSGRCRDDDWSAVMSVASRHIDHAQMRAHTHMWDYTYPNTYEITMRSSAHAVCIVC